MSSRSTSSKVMLVSPNKGLGRQLRACLSDIGIGAGALMTVKNGHTGLAALTRVRPRLVVLDDGIADMQAQDLLRALHHHDTAVLVLYLATRHTPELERRVRQIGVLYYTEKPLDTGLCEKVLGAALASPARPIGNRDTDWRAEKSTHQR